MSNWTHTLTVIVPELLMVQANQLALAMGTSPDDVNTFRQADWTDGISNYAVAHTQAVEQIMEYFVQMPVELASGVVFPTISINPEGIAALTGSDMTKVQVFMDAEPFAVFSLLNLTRRDVAEIEV
jgi:hypothetical protein